MFTVKFPFIQQLADIPMQLIGRVYNRSRDLTFCRLNKYNSLL